MRTFTILLTIVLWMIVASPQSHAQNIRQDRIQWVSDSTASNRNTESFAYSCTFISSPDEITWLQKSGTRVKHFVIRSVVGEWTDLARTGRVEFHVTEGTVPGKIVFEKTASSTRVEMDFTQQNPDGIKQRFFVNQVQRQN